MWHLTSMILPTWNVMRIEDATNNNWKTLYEPFVDKIWWLDMKLKVIKCHNEWINTPKKFELLGEGILNNKIKYGS